MFEFFPGNYRWSYNTWAALAAGAEFGGLGLILDRLRESGERDGPGTKPGLGWPIPRMNQTRRRPRPPRAEIADFSMRNFRMSPSLRVIYINLSGLVFAEW